MIALTVAHDSQRHKFGLIVFKISTLYQHKILLELSLSI